MIRRILMKRVLEVHAGAGEEVDGLDDPDDGEEQFDGLDVPHYAGEDVDGLDELDVDGYDVEMYGGQVYGDDDDPLDIIASSFVYDHIFAESEDEDADFATEDEYEAGSPGGGGGSESSSD
ncbi:hypothetical protein TSUD_387990 [Trifolium subterraneum]|uniref:Uncharacterized protein n=1 Tax=Trifolium subterraneum TaxID=3900 RepID=A0A2Z6NWS0_TRISU|nr:hypothetical protein TSUD_387990 [Trifolium subterraneum]